jgi:hypothetical protein
VVGVGADDVGAGRGADVDVGVDVARGVDPPLQAARTSRTAPSAAARTETFMPPVSCSGVVGPGRPGTRFGAGPGG